ncbi:MAG: hypothetical protein JWO44_759 [Bacteroidetes bacterium]|nr:hypothetical protein [Bacteroidota bacterium]
MKAIKKIIPALFFFLLVSCIHQRRVRETEREYGKLMPVQVDVFKYVSEFSDSCRKHGIDSVLIFSAYYSGTNLYPPLIYEYPALGKKYRRYKPESYSVPCYIFWARKGHYYLKKIDQFSTYKTIEREFYQDFPLFDFFKRNQEEISMENELTQLKKPDLIEYDLIIHQPVQYYHYISPSAPSDFYQKIFAPNTIYIEINYDKQSFSKTVKKYKYQPLIQTNDSTTDLYGNDQKNYYENQQLKINQWANLIEAELFDIESRHLLAREKKKEIGNINVNPGKLFRY